MKRRLRLHLRPESAMTSRTAWSDLVAIAFMGAAALTTLDSVYAGRKYLLVGMTGLLLGLGVGWLANRRGWMPVTAVGLALVVLVLSAGPLILPETLAAAVIPTRATLTGFADGAIGSWRGLLTTTPPVPASGTLLFVPYLSGAIAGLSSALLCGRSRSLAAAVAGPGAMLIAGLLMGTEKPASPLISGGLFGVVALVSAIVRHGREVQMTRTGMGSFKRRAQTIGIVSVAALAASTVVLTPAVAGIADRYVLREHVELPFDPSVYPSPLSGYRRFEVTQKRDVLFSITGVPADSRIRLAVMDTYDGLVWKVAGSGGRHAASGVFERVGARIPAEQEGRTATVTVTIRALGGVWIPTVGSVTSMRFPGQRGPELVDNFRYNRVTGSGVLRTPSQLRSGDTVTFEAIVPEPVSQQGLPGRPVEDVTLPFLSGVPDQVDMVAADWTAGVTGAYASLDAMVKRMRNGAFSDGTNLSGAPSWSGHSAGRIREFLGAGQLVGDAEQYAATLALMARGLGLPARVVLGVVPPAADWTGGEVTGQMVSAWVEVRFAGAGWVPFDPTPPVTNVPQPPKPPSDVDGTTEVVHPPVIPELPPAQRPPLNATEDVPSTSRSSCLWCRTVFVILAIVLPPLILIFGIVGTLLYLKIRRRRRRRSQGTGRQRIAAGWLELLDGMRDYRVPVPDGLTRLETVKNLYLLPSEQLDQPHKVTARGLAHRADEAVFGPQDVITAHVRFWHDVEEAIRALGDGRPWWHRIGAALNPVTLLPAGARR